MASCQVLPRFGMKGTIVPCAGLPGVPLFPRKAFCKIQGIRPRRLQVQAIAAPVEKPVEITLPSEVANFPSSAQDAIRLAAIATAAESPEARLARKAKARAMGYTTIGLDLPKSITLSAVVNSIPKEAFQINPWRAWGSVLTTVCAVSLSIYLLQISPPALLPFAWAFAGTAWTGMFVIGHDCGHRSFSQNKLVEDIVGTIMFAPLIYPFEPWRILHNAHHAHTNKLKEDTAWHPVMDGDLDKWPALQRWLFKSFLGTPLKLWASVGHQLFGHFDPSTFTAEQRQRVVVSLAAVAAFAVFVLGPLTYYTGPWGLFKYWAAPWLGYHFWMSTFTVVHHTARHIPFKPKEEWNAAQAQLGGTVHCNYPFWVEFLCHDINVHVPHHVSSKIPWYNLRSATDSLRKYYGEFMTEGDWNWTMMKTIFTELHMYDKENNYKPFDHEKESFLGKTMRRYLPG